MLNPHAKDLFKKTAQHLWRDLGKRHKHALNKAEVGITDDIIYLLSRYARKHSWSGIRVWRSKNEAQNGHDIDLFIKGRGKRSGYYWFPLQAKVLADTKRYESANHVSPHGEQWALLNKLRDNTTKANSIFCAPYYLLYNGFSAKCRAQYINAHTPAPQTIAAAWRSSLGCSLVDINEFHCISAPRPPAVTNKPLYHELHNHITLATGGSTFPWHHLFKLKTAITRPRGLRLLSERELLNRLSFYQNVVAPRSKSATPISYYYPIDNQFLNEDGKLRGRFAIVIKNADQLDKIFS